MDTQLLADPADRALGPRRVSQRLQRHPRGPLAQLIGALLLSHDSDPSVSSLPPSNPGRFKKYGCRRHATWAGQVVSALEHQTVVVAGTAAVLAGRDPGQELQAPEPIWPPVPDSLLSHAAPAHRPVASTSPTAATRGSSAPCSCPPSPHCAPTPSLGPTSSANLTKVTAAGQALLTLAHRRI